MLLKLIICAFIVWLTYRLLDKKALKKKLFDATIFQKYSEKNSAVKISPEGIPFESEKNTYYFKLVADNKEYIEEVSPNCFNQNSIGSKVKLVRLYTRFSDKFISNQIIN